MQKKMKNTSLIWFGNNLRVNDNNVLHNACKTDGRVIGLYCIDPRSFGTNRFGFRKTEKFRAKFLLESLHDLKNNLDALNIDLLVYFEPPESIIPKICKRFGVNAIHAQNEWTQEETELVEAVKLNLPSSTEWNFYDDQFLYHPDDIGIDTTKIPQVFTVFRKKLEKYASIRALVSIEKQKSENRIENDTKIPSLTDLGFEDFKPHPNSAFPFKGGENEALQRLDHYFFETKKLGFYKKTRNGLIGKDYSSKFSAWLANGSISARTIYSQVKVFEKDHYKNQSTYWLIFELIWRDYFKYIALKHGNQIFKLGGILNKSYDWNRNQKNIHNWINGETPSDFVNANMIELKETGWMSNRGRQNVASYFAKDMYMDWRIGASYFESVLIDYDVHSNYGNWMYVAGVGNDPRDRKFNVASQAERYDSAGKFRKLWLQPSLF